jgi:toxin ParE1/3/4
MNVIWSPTALRHLSEVCDYIARENPKAAASTAHRLLAAAELLSRQPHLGRAGRIPGTRELVVAGTPYVIPYRFRQEQLELIAVFHGRQHWPEQV